MISFLSKSYQNFLDRAVHTPEHGKYVVDGFNAAQEQYLATCLRMCRTLEVDNIDSKHIRVYAMNDKGELSFAE